jgi:peptidoglycan hydrolase CwlO-like protein
MTLVQVPSSHAAPVRPAAVDLDQVEEQVRHLEFQASAAVEAWNESRTKLEKVNRKIANLKIRSQKASSAYKAVSKDYGTVVRSLYKSGTVDIELQALFSEDPAQFLQQLDAVSYVGSKQFSTMRKLAAASVNVKTANALLKAQQLKAKRLYERSQQHLKRANQKLREAKAVLAKLKAEERRKYLERQRKKQAQQGSIQQNCWRYVSSILPDYFATYSAAFFRECL